jgi:hypothetical protein
VDDRFPASLTTALGRFEPPNQLDRTTADLTTAILESFDRCRHLLPVTWRDSALLQLQPRDAYVRLLEQGWTDALRTRHPAARIYTFWDHRSNRSQRDAGLRIDHLLLRDSLGKRLLDAGPCAGWKTQAITRLPGLSLGRDQAPR